MKTTDSVRKMIEHELALRTKLGLTDASLQGVDLYGHAWGLGSAAMTVRAAQEEIERHIGLGGLSGDLSVLRHSQDTDVRNIAATLGGSSAADVAQAWVHLNSQPGAGSMLADAAMSALVSQQLYRLPQELELGQIAAEVMKQSILAPAVFDTQEQLKTAMGGLNTPWAQVDGEFASARAISDLLAIGRGIDKFGGFDESFARALRPVLGDWRDAPIPTVSQLLDPTLRFGFYQDRGFDPRLTNFPAKTFDEFLDLSGLYAPLNDQEVIGDPEPIEDDDELAQQVYALLRRFEIEMRRFIDSAMSAAFGDKWYEQQVPSNRLEQWRAKRDKEIADGHPEQRLIDYADFTDYKIIIEKNENWLRVFQPVFRRKEDVQESLVRLYPVRIATMHARSVTQADRLLLHFEVTRVLRAIGVD